MLKNLWQYGCIKTKCPENVAILKNYIEEDWVYDFLVGLNTEFDQVRVQIPSKKLPTLNETISIIQVEESRSVMLEPQNKEDSTMVANKGSDQKASTIDNKKTNWSRASNCDNRENLWGTYCQEPKHTWENYWNFMVSQPHLAKSGV